MANGKTGVLDLPRPVRNRIYRLHLVQDTEITARDYRTTVGAKPWTAKAMPPICHVSPQLAKEAAPIYYSENHFSVGPDETIWALLAYMAIRHVRLIRKVTINWPLSSPFGEFKQAAKMRGLQELYIRVDEEAFLKKAEASRGLLHHWIERDSTSQEQLKILKAPGMPALLKLKASKKVKFINVSKKGGGKPVYSDVLEKIVAPMLMTTWRPPKFPKNKRRKGEGSALLELPIELRTLIYHELMQIEGPLEPSPQPPSSADFDIHTGSHSVLSILLVNQQIHDEAVPVFYRINQLELSCLVLNQFVFSLSTQRFSNIRHLALHYDCTTVTTISVADMVLPMLTQLRGLRCLFIVLTDDLFARMKRLGFSQAGQELSKANPMELPGLKVLFSLRGIAHIKVRDMMLESALEDNKEHPSFPDFADGTWEGHVVRMDHILQHFNAAIADAQDGNINQHLFLPDWHMKHPLPNADDPFEDAAEDEGEGEDEEGGDAASSDDPDDPDYVD